jgi:hypothetical protein
MGIDRKADTGAAAHLSEVTALPFSPSHSLVMSLEVLVPLELGRQLLDKLIRERRSVNGR